MSMKSGKVIINGITADDLIELRKVKDDPGAGIQFNPQALQLVATETLLGRAPVSIYNNVNLSWSSDSGLDRVIKILQTIRSQKKRT